MNKEDFIISKENGSNNIVDNGSYDQSKANEASDISLSEIFKKAAYHWPLYLVVLILSVIAAFIILRYTTPVYSSTAKIYIKDEKKSGPGGNKTAALEDLGMFGGSKLVENEMEVIKSPLILVDVIRDNKFNVRYFAKGNVREYELYENSPISLSILTDSFKVGNYLFDITMRGNKELIVKYQDQIKVEKQLKVEFDKAFIAGKDKFVIKYNPLYNPGNLDEFQIRVDLILQLAYKKSNELTTTLVNKQASVVLMSYQDEVAKRTADFLNAIVERYNLYTLDDKNQTAFNTIKFIEGRLQGLGKELNLIERDVESFKKSRGITEIDQSSRLFLEQVKDADVKLSEANIQLSVLDQVERYVNTASNDAPFTPIAGNVDPALNSLINRYQESISERKRLSLSLQPNNPILQNVDQQIADTKSTIRSYIGGYRRNAVTAKSGLQRKVNQIEGLISQVPTYERQFINLERQKSVKEALYLFLLQTKEESAVSYAANIVDNKIISPAFIPIKPSSPNRLLTLVGLIVAGFALTSVYLAFKYLLSNKINSKKDIEKITGIPVIGQINKQDELEAKQTFFDTKTRSVLYEQMLNVRTNLKFVLNEVEHAPVILFTSSISGEGKTFLSAHLGHSLTSQGKKVIMLELDLRKPKLAKTLKINTEGGLTNYLIGSNSLDQIVQKVPETDRLYIIPSGPIPPNPVELIESEKLKNLFLILKKEYDYIIIDTAPAGLVSDAISLNPYIDASIFVVRFNYTPLPKLKDVFESMEKVSLKKMNIIFNGIDRNSSYGSYYGGYSYGYGYGHGNEANYGIKSFFRKFKHRFL